jgi:DNA-binding NarL/FixJ family response regulator
MVVTNDGASGVGPDRHSFGLRGLADRLADAGGVLRTGEEDGVFTLEGFLPKGSPGGTLADVIRRVHAGRRYVDPALAADALTAPECPLTPRELEVLRLAEFDTPVAVIARRTHLSHGTVRNYLAAAVNKLGVSSRAEAFRTAHDNGWL